MRISLHIFVESLRVIEGITGRERGPRAVARGVVGVFLKGQCVPAPRYSFAAYAAAETRGSNDPGYGPEGAFSSTTVW